MTFIRIENEITRKAAEEKYKFSEKCLALAKKGQIDELIKLVDTERDEVNKELTEVKRGNQAMTPEIHELYAKYLIELDYISSKAGSTRFCDYDLEGTISTAIAVQKLRNDLFRVANTLIL